jgi:pyruvate/2-oxoglutarate dehydrogenase complex dihydrolipoamide dehydrogenase (E3) component
VGYLTNETVFSLTQMPPRLAVIGGGPIGCELAQTFQRLGCRVTQIEQAQHLLIREDADAAEVVQQSLLADGVGLKLKARIKKVEKNGAHKRIILEINNQQEEIDVDEILVGVGRAPNIEALNLDKVGVNYNKAGITVSDTLQTSNARIFACGDICMDWKFTHAADFAARTAIRNTLFPFLPKAKLSALIMPWATYTSPEVAHVGIYEHEAEEKGIELDTYRRDFKDVDRAIAEGDTAGFVKIHTKKGSGRILGATIVAEHAGDMISEISVAMRGKVSLGSLASVIHPYPTMAEAIRQCGDAYNRTRLTPLAKRIFHALIGMQR